MNNEKEEQLLLTVMSKCSEKERSSLSRWSIKQSISIQARIEKDKKHYFYKLKSLYPDAPQELQSLAANFLSMQDQYNILKNNDSKDSGAQAGKKLYVRVDAMKKRKRKTKQELVLERQGDLKRLYYDENLSYREVSHYFKVYLHIDVSHMTIGKVLHALEAC